MTLAAAGALVLGAATTSMAAVPRQAGSLTYTTTVPGAPTGLTFDFAFQNPDDPEAKPHTLQTLVVHPPQAGAIDTSVPPQCHATDAELRVRGPEGCPPDSQIGTAVAISDTGGRDPFPRLSRTNITQFNEPDGIVAVGVNENIPALKPVDHTRIEPERTTTTFPLVPASPPPEPFAAFKHLRFEIRPYVRDGRTYNHTPPTCPATGHWVMTLEFRYLDGVTETIESRSPCERARPRLRIGHRDVRVDRRGTLVELRCAGPAGSRCVGRIQLEATGRESRLRGSAATAPIAFDVAAGSSRAVRVQVPAASRRRLAAGRTAVARARARLVDGSEVARLLTLKRLAPDDARDR